MNTFIKMPSIPQAAFDLMRTKRPVQVYTEMQENRGLPLMEALTFGMVNTPIVYNKTGATVGYVVYWFIEEMTAAYQLEGDWLHLLGMEKRQNPSADECAELYEKYLYANKEQLSCSI